MYRADTDPQHFGRAKCFPCKAKVGAYMRQGGVYRIKCMICLEGSKETQYIGESWRTLYDSGLEHLTAHRNRCQESVLVKYEFNCHQGEMVEWQKEVVSFQPRNLAREAMEAHLISNQDDKTTMINRKGELGRNLAPKLTLDDNRPTNRKKGRP